MISPITDSVFYGACSRLLGFEFFSTRGGWVVLSQDSVYGTAGAGRMAPLASTRIPARLERAGDTAHP